MEIRAAPGWAFGATTIFEEVGMSTFKNLIARLPHPQGELIQPLVQGASSSVRRRVCQDAAMRQPPGSLMCRLGTFVRECWRRMGVMEAASERAESGGAQSRERSKERLRDEQGWAENSSSVSQTELRKKG